MKLFRSLIAAIAGGTALAALQSAEAASATPGSPEPAHPAATSGAAGAYADVSGTISFAGTGYFKAPDSYKEPSASGGWTYLKNSFVKVDCANLKIDAVDTTGKTIGSTTATMGSEPGTCSYDLRVPAGVSLSIEPDVSSRNAVLGTIEDESPKEELKTELKNKTDAQWKIASNLKISSDSQFLKTSPGSHTTVPLALSADP